MKKKTRIAVLVSGGGTNLQALIDAERRGEIPDGEIVLVVGSLEGIYALERAEKAGIEHTVIHKDEPKLIETLQAHDIELVILAGYLTILGPDFIHAYADRIINIHPSLIPSFCGKGMYGLRPHEAALAYGVKPCISSMKFQTVDASFSRRPSPSRREIHRRFCRSGSWSRPSGSCSRRPQK